MLDLSFNHFSGNIPHEVGSLSVLRELYLGNNHFRGIHISSYFNLQCGYGYGYGYGYSQTYTCTRFCILLIGIFTLQKLLHLNIGILVIMKHSKLSYHLQNFSDIYRLVNTNFRRNTSTSYRESYSTRVIKYQWRLSNRKYSIIYLQYFLFEILELVK